ncbi:MAG: MFS transporter [Rhizobiales bacterium]|nr:MFS transporter [Hyphomicrobiales bacterium]
MSPPIPSASFPVIPWGATVSLVGTLGAVYILSQFLRNSVGVIAPNLAEELGLAASEIGLLSSVFFFAFAGSQLPLGVALDRWGPKLAMLVCSAVAIAGTILFALATAPASLIAARILMGVGSCCFLMAPLALYARRYPPERFASLTGIQLGVGTIGTLLATAPLAFSAAMIGWRMTFMGVAGLMLIAAALIALVVREEPLHAHATAPRETLRASIAGYFTLLRMPSVARLFLMQLVGYSSFLLVVGLWGGPYLTHIYGLDLIARGDMLFIAAIAQVVGLILWGNAMRMFGGHKLPVVIGALATAGALAAVTLFGILPRIGLIIWLITVGGASASVVVLIAHGKALFPPHLVGRGLTLMNVGTMGGVFLTQTLSGALIDLFPVQDGAYALDAYRLVFGLQAAFILIACIFYLGARDPHGEVGRA